jgi:hypothetical protein
MKVLIEPETSAEVWRYPHTQDLHYRTYANSSFQTSLGAMRHYGNPFDEPYVYQRNECVLDGDKLVSEEIELDSTEDSPDNPDARYSTFIFSGNIRLRPRLLGYPVKQTNGTLTWDHLTLARNASQRSRIRSGTYDQPSVEFLLERALASLRYASVVQAGHAFSSHPAVDPLAPIHVSVTHPLWTALEAGSGLIAAAGKAVMANGEVLVNSGVVAADSVIIPSSMSRDVSGQLVAVDVIVGESFRIVSNNFGDNGDVAWLMANPS